MSWISDILIKIWGYISPKWNNWKIRQKILCLLLIFVILLVIGLMYLGFTEIVNHYKRANIYLNLREQDRPRVPLNKNYEIIQTAYDIKEGSKISLKFSLTQGNDDPPKITKIIVDFPDGIVVKPIPSGKFIWCSCLSTNSKMVENQYYIDLSNKVLTNDSDVSLPSFDITFTNLSDLFVRYTIGISKIGTVKHVFKLGTERYPKELIRKTENEYKSQTTPVVTPDMECLPLQDW